MSGDHYSKNGNHHDDTNSENQSHTPCNTNDNVGVKWCHSLRWVLSTKLFTERGDGHWTVASTANTNQLRLDKKWWLLANPFSKEREKLGKISLRCIVDLCPINDCTLWRWRASKCSPLDVARGETTHTASFNVFCYYSGNIITLSSCWFFLEGLVVTFIPAMALSCILTIHGSQLGIPVRSSWNKPTAWNINCNYLLSSYFMTECDCHSHSGYVDVSCEA